MQSVYKYEVLPYNVDTMLPDGAKILSVGEQDKQIYVWALVDSAIHAKAPRRIRAYGTGHVIEDGERVFIGTVQMQNGLVFHFFEEM